MCREGRGGGESRKVLDVWREPKWIGRNLGEMENQVWAELCFGSFSVPQLSPLSPSKEKD